MTKLVIIAEGAATDIVFGSGAIEPGRYALVSIGSLLASHRADTGEATRGFDAAIQCRVYDGVEGQGALALAQTMVLDPLHVLDQTAFAALGPPIVRRDGHLVAGNQRTMVMQIARLYPRRWERYTALLLTRASAFGLHLDGDNAESIEDGVVVRVLLADRSVARLAELNSLSDVPLSKSFDPLSGAVRAARRLADDSEALKFLREHIGRDTFAQFLSGERGYVFARLLSVEGVVDRTRLPELKDGSRQRLRGPIRREIANLLDARALESVRLLRYVRYDPEVRRLIVPALLRLGLAIGPNARWLRSKVQAAIEFHYQRGSPLLAGADRDTDYLFKDFAELPSLEAQAIASWISRTPNETILGPIDEFLSRTEPREPDLFEPEQIEAEDARFTRVCFEQFGPAPAFIPLTPQGLRGLLRAIGSLSDRRQRRATALVLSPDVLSGAQALLDPPTSARRARGRPFVPCDGLVRALSLLLRAQVPEAMYHRYWPLMPRAWQCGAWTTFVSRRARWRSEKPNRWEALCAMLRTELASARTSPPERTVG